MLLERNYGKDNVIKEYNNSNNKDKDKRMRLKLNYKKQKIMEQ